MEIELKRSRDVLKRVVKRKKALLCKSLKVDSQTVEDFASSGVINPAITSIIKSGNDGNHMGGVIDNLLLDSPESREKFLDFIRLQSIWMYEEILTEAKAETSDIQIDDYEIDDASFLIHRHFGSSRRFSEGDKKTMTSLVATKSQVAKEVWSRRLAAAKSDLEETRNVLEEREKLVEQTNEMIKTFIRRNERELHDFAREKSTTQNLILNKGKKEGDNALTELMNRTEFLIKRFERVLLDKQALIDQRYQCMTILQVDDLSIPIHRLVKEAIDKLSKDNEEGRMQVKTLKRKTIELEEQLNSKDVQLEKLRTEIDEIKQKGRSIKKVGSTEYAPKSPRERRREETVPKSPQNSVGRTSKTLPALEPTNKPKHCSRPRDNNTKTMPLHGRSFLLDVS